MASPAAAFGNLRNVSSLPTKYATGSARGGFFASGTGSMGGITARGGPLGSGSGIGAAVCSTMFGSISISPGSNTPASWYSSITAARIRSCDSASSGNRLASWRTADLRHIHSGCVTHGPSSAAFEQARIFRTSAGERNSKSRAPLLNSATAYTPIQPDSNSRVSILRFGTCVSSRFVPRAIRKTSSL